MSSGEKFKYEYEDPLKQGYVLTKIKKKHLKSIGLRNRGGTFFGKAEVYWSPENGYILQYLHSWRYKVFITVALPVIILLGGILNASEILKDYRRAIFDKKHGSFSLDRSWSSDRFYPKLEQLREKLGCYAN